MKIVTILFVVSLISSSIARAKNLAKARIVTRETLSKLLGETQVNAVYEALSMGKTVVAAYPESAPFLKHDFDLHTLEDVAGWHNEQSVIDTLKAVVHRQEDNIGYIFSPNGGDKVELHEYFYYTNKRQEWVQLADERISVLLTLDEVRHISDAYPLQQALADNFFYMKRYKSKDHASVRYLHELRNELNGNLSEQLDAELLSHNRGETLIRREYLQELETLVENDSSNFRRLQQALMAIKAEIVAEELVMQLRRGELNREDFTTEQIEYAERVVRLKNASIAKRIRETHGKLHFYAFRTPRQYLERLIANYGENNGLSESTKQELMQRLFRGIEINFNAVKFGQTDSKRQLERLQAEFPDLSSQEHEQLLLELEGQQVFAKHMGIRKKKERKPSERVKTIVRKINRGDGKIKTDNGNVDARVYEQLREIIDMQVFAQIGGDVDDLLKAAKILTHAPSTDIGMLDRDLLSHMLEKEGVEFAEMVAGKSSSETVVFLDVEGEALELDAETLALVRTRFEESVRGYSDYLDRRDRPSVSYPRFNRVAGGQKREGKAIELPPLKKLWHKFFDIAQSVGYDGSNTKIKKELKLGDAYRASVHAKVITYTHFSNIESAIKTLEKKGADREKLKELRDEFIELTPVIANSKLMADKLDKGGKDAIDEAVNYASQLSDGGGNRLENLTLISRGLKELGNDGYIKYFEQQIDAEMRQEISIKDTWYRLYDIAQSVGYDGGIEKIKKELKLGDAYQRSVHAKVITHTYFFNIESAIKTLEKKGADREKLKELRDEFIELTPVIANSKLMAAKLAKGGEDAIDEAVNYASQLSDGGGNRLENLTLIYRGLDKLGNDGYIKYFEQQIDAEMRQEIQDDSIRSSIKDTWHRLFDIAQSVGYDGGNTKIRKELKLGAAYRASVHAKVITYTHFSNIESAIKTLEKKGADREKLKELRDEFIEFTPVIANSKLMAAKLAKGGEDAIDEAVNYASQLSDGGGNRLENLTLIYRGLDKLGNDGYIEYFEQQIDAEMRQEIQDDSIRSSIKDTWQRLYDIAQSVGYDGGIEKIKKELKLGDAYQRSVHAKVITHTYFFNIESAIKTLEKKGADREKLKELRDEFIEFTPVIANSKLMADKLAKGGEDAIDEAVNYASQLSDGGGNRLENLTLISRGLKELGNDGYIKYFEQQIAAEMRQKIGSPVKDTWQRLFDIAQSVGYDGGIEKIGKELKLDSAYKTSVRAKVITYTHFSNIESAIEKLKKKGADREKLKELRDEFIELTPVIANSKLMADKLDKGGEDAIDEAVNYASQLSDGGGNRLENLTLISRGLKELGNDGYIKYFEQQLDKQTLEKIRSRMWNF